MHKVEQSQERSRDRHQVQTHDMEWEGDVCEVNNLFLCSLTYNFTSRSWITFGCISACITTSIHVPSPDNKFTPHAIPLPTSASFATARA